MNRLNMSFGINYKYNGLLHHNLERVWVVTKIADISQILTLTLTVSLQGN